MIKFLSDVNINGLLEAIEKSFSIKHPLKPGFRLVYGVVEGPEHSVYIRGNSTGVIHLPEDWKWLVDCDTISLLSHVQRISHFITTFKQHVRIFQKSKH
jgi:hypothetical protein